MTRTPIIVAAALALAVAPALTLAEAAAPDAAPPATRPVAAEGRAIDVCFVLDTTGSMSGLIAGAKAKIWSIANAVVAAEPGATLRFGLVAYRDRGDAYVTRRTDLTADLDQVFADLQAFEADGGGDGPESVNQALAEAVNATGWTPGEGATRIVFLVGDAPPHMDYEQDVPYADTLKVAAGKGVIVNAVQCGNQTDTAEVWREIARLGGGSFVQLPQDGAVQVVETPVDAELAELNRQVGRTVVAYGGRFGGGAGPAESAAQVGGRLREKQAASEAAPAAAAADRAAYNAATGKAVQGDGELIAAIDAGRVKLGDLKDEQLPDDLRGLRPAEREAKVDELRRERAELQAKIAELTGRRNAFIADAAKRQAADGKDDGFDRQAAQIVAAQASRGGGQAVAP